MILSCEVVSSVPVKLLRASIRTGFSEPVALSASSRMSLSKPDSLPGLDLILAHTEHNFSLQRRCRVVHVDDRTLDAYSRDSKCPADQVLAGLGENLDVVTRLLG